MKVRGDRTDCKIEHSWKQNREQSLAGFSQSGAMRCEAGVLQLAAQIIGGQALAPGVPSLSCPPSHCQKAPLPVPAHNDAPALISSSLAGGPSRIFTFSGNLPRIAKNPTSLKPHLECCWKFPFAQNYSSAGCGLGKRQIIDDFCTTCHNVCACAVSKQQQQDDW